jgi:thioredoxin-dependent peroxiredoxin
MDGIDGMAEMTPHHLHPMKLKSLSAFLAFLGFASFAQADPLAAGGAAPEVSAVDQDGKTVNFKDVYAKGATLVYFYPKADTPGCTTQACGVRDHHADYAKVGTTVVGISPDTVKKVKKFHEKYDLDFPLLADADHAVADAFGVWVEKSMYGKTYFGNERTTFVIGGDGRVSHVLRKVKPADHDELVLAALAEAAPPTV